jgi:hypothetical protein
MANVKKLFTGRGKTRPIPRVIDESDRREIARMAATTVPTTKATQKSFGPRVSAPTVFGKKASGAKTPAGGTYNPTDLDSTLGAP